MKLDSEIIDIERLDAIRVGTDVTRTFEAGPTARAARGRRETRR